MIRLDLRRVSPLGSLTKGPRRRPADNNILPEGLLLVWRSHVIHPHYQFGGTHVTRPHIRFHGCQVTLTHFWYGGCHMTPPSWASDSSTPHT